MKELAAQQQVFQKQQPLFQGEIESVPKRRIELVDLRLPNRIRIINLVVENVIKIKLQLKKKVKPPLAGQIQ